MPKAMWLVLACGLIVAVGVGIALTPSQSLRGTVSTGTPAIGGPFRLDGTNGQAVTEASFPNKWKIIYFGYTFCPDVCPTTLAALGQALDALGPQATQIQPLFVTVDPKRDTLAVLKEYLSNFDSRIVGLTGTQDQVDVAKKAFRVYAAIHKTDAGPENYLVDHSSILYIMNPKGVYVTHISASLGGPDMAAALRDVLKANNS